jgi:Ser/Thr protein kinase RdoA (MazF antagonist)
MQAPALSNPATSSPVTGLKAFDALTQDATVPAWLRDAICSAYGLGEDTIVRLLSVSENASFLIETPDGPLGVVRVQQPGYHSGDQLLSELDWVAAIRSDLVAPVPALIEGPGRDRLFSAVAPGGGTVTFVMFEFVSGRILQDQPDLTPWFHEIGAITARLHGHARQWESPVGFDRFVWDLPDLLGSTSRWGDWRGAELTADELDLLERAERQAMAVVAQAEKNTSSWGLIHSDLRPTNLMHEGGRLTVIDFDDSGFGWFMYDFAAAMTFMEHTPAAPAMARQWIAGYRSAAPLTDEEVWLGCHLVMIRCLTMLGWSTTHRPEALPPELQGRIVPAACAVAERFLTSATWLTD